MYQTDAQESLQTAKEHIEKALFALSDIVIKRVDGYNHFVENYSAAIKESYFALVDIRDKLET